MAGKLYIIPSVIADDTSEVIPQQVRDVLLNTNYFLAENIRTARRYISSLKLGITIEELHFEILDKKTNPEQLNNLLKPLLNGQNVGILSESGCPGIADPGALAVAYAQQKDIEVIPLVGPSSILLSLMASGFNGQKFCFHGYLPIDQGKLENEIKKLDSESRKFNQTQIFIETPYRNNQLLKALIQSCSSSTLLCVAKDITSANSFIKTKRIADWKKMKIDLHKIPTVFLLYAGS